jgi:hypothetical protein
MKLYRVIALGAAIAITAFLASTPTLMVDAAARHQRSAETAQHFTTGDRARARGPDETIRAPRNP